MNEWLNTLRHNRYLPYILVLVLASFLFWNLWSLTNVTLPLPETKVADLPASSLVVKKNEINKAFHYPLFGVYVPENMGGDIKPSTLNIKVVGIMYAANPEHSHVLIELANGDQKVYKVGDILPGDAQIKKIMSDALVIWYNNRLERINLPQDELNFKSQEAPLQQELL